MSDNCLIKGATVVSDGIESVQDVRLADGRIVEMGPDLSDSKANTFHAAGLHLLPGLIDDQVHFRDPGLTHKADMESESAAAVAGGITSFMEMPNTSPATTNAAALQEKLDRAAQVSAANYGFYLGATGDNESDIRAAANTAACGVKVFLGASTGDLLVSDQERLEQVFAAVPKGMVLAAHCEDNERVKQRAKDFLAEHGEGLPMAMHPQIRDSEACYRSTKRAIDLARRHQTRLHVLHISTARELDLFSADPLEQKLVTAEACVHHLMFTDADYAGLGGRIKCNPAIKTENDRAKLRDALTKGIIDVVATDHAPHLIGEKQGNYAAIAAGLPLVECSLLVLLELVRDGVLSLADVARLGAHNPARLFGLRERGHVKVGNHADLVLVDLAGTTLAKDETALSKCGWTPFAGHEFPAAIKSVWVSGRIAYADGQVQQGTGSQLEFARDDYV